MIAPTARILLIVVFVGFGDLSSALGQIEKPITRGNLISSVKLGKREGRTAAWYIELVKLYGVDFLLTRKDEQALRHYGNYLGKRGLDDLIEALRKTYQLATQRRGLLLPGSDPTPTGGYQPKPGQTVFYFGNLCGISNSQSQTIVRIDGEDVLSFERTIAGSLFISAVVRPQMADRWHGSQRMPLVSPQDRAITWIPLISTLLWCLTLTIEKCFT